jgi:prepilin-type processing-associated H-X9-DG protein
MYAEDHQGRLPSAELLPSVPLDPQAPLPRIADLLAPSLGAAAGTSNRPALFRCPADRTGRFETEGSSYEWNTELNGHRIDETRSAIVKTIRVVVIDGQPPERREETHPLLFPPETTMLLLDYEAFHPRSPRPGKNVVYMDGHAAGLELLGPAAGF